MRYETLCIILSPPQYYVQVGRPRERKLSRILHQTWTKWWGEPDSPWIKRPEISHPHHKKLHPSNIVDPSLGKYTLVDTMYGIRTYDSGFFSDHPMLGRGGTADREWGRMLAAEGVDLVIPTVAENRAAYPTKYNFVLKEPTQTDM